MLEQRLAALEGGIARASRPRSGQAAVTYSVLNVARAGDNIVSVSPLYGGTYNLFAHTLPQYGIEVRWADADDPAQLASLVDDKTRLVFVETIGNPRLNVVDLRRLGRRRARRTACRSIVDNTVPTPILCRAFDHGADVVGALADEVHRRPRHVDRRRRRRRRHLRLGRARRPLPRA